MSWQSHSVQMDKVARRACEVQNPPENFPEGMSRRARAREEMWKIFHHCSQMSRRARAREGTV